MNGIERYDIEELYKKTCYADNKRLVDKKSFQKAMLGLNGVLFNVDRSTQTYDSFECIFTYQNRLGQKKYFETLGEMTKNDKLKRWNYYMSQTSHPLRIRKETYDFIMNSKLSPLQMKVCLYVLSTYARNYTKKRTEPMKLIAQLFGMNINKGTYNIQIEKAVQYVMLNAPGGLLMDYEIIKKVGLRGKFLTTEIRK